MQTRYEVAVTVILILGVAAVSFAAAPLSSQQPADVPAARATPGPHGHSDPEKRRKADAITRREAVKARIARCRMHPETCRQ